MAEEPARRAGDALLPEFLQELGAIRHAVRSLDQTLQETRETVKHVGELAVRTDREFRAFRYGLKAAIATASVFMTVVFSALGYYFNQRDVRLEELTGEVARLAKLAVHNQAENKRQTEIDKQLQAAMIEALKAIRANQERR